MMPPTIAFTVQVVPLTVTPVLDPATKPDAVTVLVKDAAPPGVRVREPPPPVSRPTKLPTLLLTMSQFCPVPEDLGPMNLTRVSVALFDRNEAAWAGTADVLVPEIVRFAPLIAPLPLLPAGSEVAVRPPRNVPFPLISMSRDVPAALKKTKVPSEFSSNR